MTVRSLYAFQVILIVLMPIDASQCEMRVTQGASDDWRIRPLKIGQLGVKGTKQAPFTGIEKVLTYPR
jgi:hypothetical protein